METFFEIIFWLITVTFSCIVLVVFFITIFKLVEFYLDILFKINKLKIGCLIKDDRRNVIGKVIDINKIIRENNKKHIIVSVRFNNGKEDSYDLNEFKKYFII